MALAPNKWQTGSTSGDKRYKTPSQIAERVAAIRSNRGLGSNSNYDKYWVNRITSGDATLGDARTELTEKARARTQSNEKKKAPVAQKPKPRAKLDLLPNQLRELMQGRRQASTGFQSTLANLNAQKQRGLAGFQTRMSQIEQAFDRQREQGMRQLGGRGQASQPMFGGRFLSDLRDDETQAAGEVELTRAQLLSDVERRKQQAKNERARMLSDLAALEAAYRADPDRIMGDA